MKRHERALRVCILPLPETYLGRENADLAGNSGKLESSLPRDLRGRISREVFALFHFTSLHPTDSTAHSNSRMRLFASPFCRLFFTRVSDVRRCSFTRCLTKKVQWLLSYRKLFFLDSHVKIKRIMWNVRKNCVGILVISAKREFLREILYKNLAIIAI